MSRAVNELENKIGSGDTVLFYFAGQGSPSMAQIICCQSTCPKPARARKASCAMRLSPRQASQIAYSKKVPAR